MVSGVPVDTVPSVHGKATRQSPAFDTKVSPAGVASVTTTPSAFDGPVFVTVIV